MSTLIKVGGSLLSLPNLKARLEQLLASLKTTHVALLIGGGEAANAVRQWDRVFHFTPEISDALAIESLSLTAQLVEHLLPQSRRCLSRDEVQECWAQKLIPIVIPSAIIQQLQRAGASPLPPSWSVTSDSIAAWIARHWPFERLLFVKSVDSPQDLAQTDDLDDFVKTLLPRLPAVWWCNLRRDPLNYAECKTR